jgi:hypothetical protein
MCRTMTQLIATLKAWMTLIFWVGTTPIRPASSLTITPAMP